MERNTLVHLKYLSQLFSSRLFASQPREQKIMEGNLILNCFGIYFHLRIFAGKMKVDTTVYESIICIFVECDAPYFLLITIFDPIELDFELNLSAYNLINLSYILTSDS